jgi:hypothetical protein
VSTNQPQGDDNGPRGEETKAVESDEAKKDEDEPEDTAKADEDTPNEDEEKHVWPVDMNAESYVDAQRKGLKKAESDDVQRPSWGYDHEAVPTS